MYLSNISSFTFFLCRVGLIKVASLIIKVIEKLNDFFCSEMHNIKYIEYKKTGIMQLNSMYMVDKIALQ